MGLSEQEPPADSRATTTSVRSSRIRRRRPCRISPQGDSGLATEISADSPLAGVRVIELTHRWGEFCGRLLAGLGADVIKVEPPDGAPSRRIGPFFEDVPGLERSLNFWQYNLGKRGVTLDLERAEERDLLRRLIATANVVLESYPPGQLDRLGLGYASFSAQHPSLVWLSMTDFGQTGPYRDWVS